MVVLDGRSLCIGDVLGEGAARWGGHANDAGTLLVAAGLAPVTRQAKEGLALISGTQAHAIICRHVPRLIGDRPRRRTLR